MKYTTATPYTASYIILKRDGKVAFVYRSHTGWMNEHYGLPSGKVEKNESYVACAIREAKEEVGIEVQPVDLRFVHVMHRREGFDWVDIYFEAIVWQGEPYNAEPHLHSELVWFDPNNLPSNIIPSVRYAFEKIAAGQQYSEYGWV